MRPALACLVWGLSAWAAPQRGAAQASTAQIDVAVVVVPVALSLTSTRELAFGAVRQGVSTTVRPADAGAGEWQVSGDPEAVVTIAFELPTRLANGAPGVTMPIAFDLTTTRVRRRANDPHAAAPFDPTLGLTAQLGPRPDPALYIRIGGTVSPTPTQVPGRYTGTIVISLAYL